MPSPDLTLTLDHTFATVPTEESDDGLEYLGGGGSSLTIVSGLDVSHALGYAGFGNDAFVTDAIKLSGGGLVPQTLGTAVYQKIHLVAGTRLVIDSIFAPGDTRYNDESFALLKNLQTGAIAKKHIANVDDVNRGGLNWQTVFNIDTTGDYNLMVGVADVGDKTLPSSLSITALSIVVPAGQYSVLQSGLQLSDNSVLRSDGSLQLGGTVVPGALADSGAAVVAGLQSLLAQQLISQDGSGIVSHDSGGIVSHDSGGIVSHDSGGLLSQDGAGLLSQDGAGAIGSAQLAQIAASLAATNGLQARAYAAASASELVNHNYGIMSLDGQGERIPSDAGQPGGPPTPGLEVNATPGAVSLRYDDSSAVADLGNGRYVVAFLEALNSPIDPATGTPTKPTTYAIRVQTINADGTKFGDELTASPTLPATTQYGTPANELYNPSIASLGGGSFVVAWQNGNNVRATDNGSTGSDLFAQVFNADGSKNGSLISLDPQTSNAQYSNVKVSALSGGGFVAVWDQTADVSNSLASIHGKLFNADGTQRGNEFTLSGNSVFADLRQPAITATSDGGFAISFQGRATDPTSGSTITGIGAERYSADGVAATRIPSIVAASNTDTITASSLAVLANGDFAIAWFDSPGVGASPSLYSMVLSPSLVSTQTDATLITGSASQYYGAPSVTALSDGRFAVGYTDFAASVYTVQAQIMTADNAKVGVPFAVYAPGAGDAVTNPALLQLSTGTLIAASTHKFYYSPQASDVRALPVDLGGSSSAHATTPGQALTIGSAVDGYVSGGTVFADANGNGIQDRGEASATTTADGAFALPPGAKGTLVLTGGTDIATGRPFAGRYLAPSGSHAINALTTLVQDVLGTGADIGTAQMKVTTALGLSADTALADLDPMSAASRSSLTGKAVLITNALVADVANLATAAGASDPLASFASSIAAHNGFTAFDPSSLGSLSAAGLSGQVLTDAGAIAKAVKALLTTRAAVDGGNGAVLANDVNRLEVVVQQGAAEFASAIKTGTTATVAAAYTGDALQAKFDAAAVFVTPVTVGVYRFFDTRYGTHFFTASVGERDTILQTRPDLVNEGVGLTAIDPASKDPNAAPVFRFFDTKYGTHFFTASASERDQVMANRSDLTFEGAGFYEHTTQQAGDTPVYRFFDKNFGTHFYTGDGGERAAILSTRPDLVDEGIGFYAPKAAA